MEHRGPCREGLNSSFRSKYLVFSLLFLTQSKVVSENGERNSFIVEKPSKSQNRPLVDYCLDLCIAGLDRLIRKLFKGF